MSKVLFIAVHPDDETLGCGGTIMMHKNRGDKIYWLILTGMSESIGYTSQQIEKRNGQIESIDKLYGFEETLTLDLPAACLDTIPVAQIISKISQVFSNIAPDVIYIPNRSDIHTDHRIAFDALIAAAKSFRCPSVARILMYECLSETEFAPAFTENAFVPNYFVDITPWFRTKLEALQIYESEVMKSPGPRSLTAVEALARFRGSRIGSEFAESFMMIYEVISK